MTYVTLVLSIALVFSRWLCVCVCVCMGNTPSDKNVPKNEVASILSHDSIPLLARLLPRAPDVRITHKYLVSNRSLVSGQSHAHGMVTLIPDLTVTYTVCTGQYPVKPHVPGSELLALVSQRWRLPTVATWHQRRKRFSTGSDQELRLAPTTV